jgi:hypothetical protein
MSIGQQPIQFMGFYVAGLLCLGSLVLKLTVEGHWSWWRVLLPLWAMFGHNILYIVVGFVWLSFVSWPAWRRRRRHHPRGCSAAVRICGNGVYPALRS